jgi:hypothetical protein
VVRGENGHAVSSYTDPPSSAQFERLAQDVQKLRFAAEETNATLKRLPQEFFTIRTKQRNENFPFIFFPVLTLGIVVFWLIVIATVTRT